jgi:hypothetical protein
MESKLLYKKQLQANVQVHQSTIIFCNETIFELIACNKQWLIVMQASDICRQSYKSLDSHAENKRHSNTNPPKNIIMYNFDITKFILKESTVIA